MSKRMRQLVTAVAAIAALATGGAVMAQAQNSAPPNATSEAGQPENSATDGPGGHADEPGNPNADHQFSGKE
jgi:hypothetical protein